MGTKRTVRTGRKDVRGHAITVSEGSVESRADAPPPPVMGEVDRLAWDGVGVSNADRVGRLVAAGYTPESFISADLDVRMDACRLRGDLMFEGNLTSEAFDVARHSDHPALSRRRVAPPLMLSDTEKVAYIDGYVSGLEGCARLREWLGAGWSDAALHDRGWLFPGVREPDVDDVLLKGVRRQAFVDAWHVEVQSDLWQSGRLPDTVTIRTSQSATGQTRLANICRGFDGVSWCGQVVSNERRSIDDGHGTARHRRGISEWFRIDQIEPMSVT